MKNNKYCIAVMSVGSGVGQSVISSCNLSNLPLFTVGLGMNPFAFGAYECDVMDMIPMIYADNYIDEVVKKCEKYSIDLIIPGSDDEAHILSKNIEIFNNIGVEVVVSAPELNDLIRSKASMCQELNSIADIFVKSYKKDELEQLLKASKIKFPLIAKPLAGFASRGVEILLSLEDLAKLNDNHIIQELAIPKDDDPFYEEYMRKINNRQNPQISEISIQILTGKDGRFLGKMASYNKLNNGVPIEMLPYDVDYIWAEMDRITPYLNTIGHRGPLNIQGRWTNEGLKLFEINARFTGITGWRALMGFNEVEYCIKDWLGIEDEIPPLKLNYSKFGIRQTTDKAILLEKNEQISKLSEVVNNKKLKEKETLLVTGAGGYLGMSLVPKLSKQGYEVYAFDLEKNKITEQFNKFNNVTCFDLKDFNKSRLDLGDVDVLIHCAFARPHNSNAQISDSLKFTNNIFTKAAKVQLPKIINISSQAVYGSNTDEIWTESSPINPDTTYGQAKYASELMLNYNKKINKHCRATSLRFSGLTGGKAGLVEHDFLAKFVKKAINGETIELQGGNQIINRLHVDDASDAIVELLSVNSNDWEFAYNVGPDEHLNLSQIVEQTVEYAHTKSYTKANYNVIKSDVNRKLMMDNSLIKKSTNWKPKQKTIDIIKSLFDYLG